MHWNFLYVRSSRSSWLERAIEQYLEKLKHFGEFQILAIKSSGHSRKQKTEKIKAEEKALLDKIDSNDFVVFFDEKGQEPRDSLHFSESLVRWSQMAKSRLVFVVGGAFGAGDELRARANQLVRISSLTLSHEVAVVAALEQIYRALNIAKGRPYHNE